MRAEAITQVDVVLRDMSPGSLSALDTGVLSRLATKAIRISTILGKLPPIEEATLPSCGDVTPRIFISPDKKPYIAMEVHLAGRYGFLDGTSNYLVAYEGERINRQRLIVLAFQDKARTRRTVILEATEKNLPDVLNELISAGGK